MTWTAKAFRTDLFDLCKPFDAYFFAFALADGHLFETTRNRGRLTIEVSGKDEGHLTHLQRELPCRATIHHRVRNTNFSEAHRSVVLTISDLSARRSLLALGFPSGAKAAIIGPPVGTYSAIDYWRGIIDADGSLGLTGRGIPFISLITVSEALAEAYFDFCEKIVGCRPRTKRNIRDRAFNIVLTKEKALIMASKLYLSNGSIALERKRERARELAEWNRPSTMRIIKEQRRWDAASDDVVRSLSIKAAAAALGRSVSSVANRRFRLRR